MGTNYYLRKTKCEQCNSYEELHIGKSSFGWCFSLHVIPEIGINNLDDWRELFSKYKIINEYGEGMTPDDMIDTIINREGKNNFTEPYPDDTWFTTMYKTWDSFHERNYSEAGPKGLLRHKISKESRCIGHGDGTYDYITGDFS